MRTMDRTWAALIVAAMLACPVVTQAGASQDDAMRRDVTALAERLGRLESENAALKKANENLAGRVAELEAQSAGAVAAGSPARTAVTVPVTVDSRSRKIAAGVGPWRRRQTRSLRRLRQRRPSTKKSR